MIPFLAFGLILGLGLVLVGLDILDDWTGLALAIVGAVVFFLSVGFLASNSHSNRNEKIHECILNGGVPDTYGNRGQHVTCYKIVVKNLKETQ